MTTSPIEKISCELELKNSDISLRKLIENQESQLLSKEAEIRKAEVISHDQNNIGTSHSPAASRHQKRPR